MYDVVIIGGGPIGLSAAKVAGDYGLSVIILEKGDQCGSEVRAETIGADPIISKIWSSSFIDDALVISTQTKQVFH